MNRDQSDAIIQSGTEVGTVVGSLFGPEGALIGGAAGGLISGIICAFVCNDDGPPPNKPPHITCPSVNSVTAAAGKTSEVVTWHVPDATDPEDGTLKVKLESKDGPGTSFKRGSHTIIYSATDSEGLKDFCYIQFDVNVVVCQEPTWVAKGYVQCHGEVIAGSTCQYNCFDGYELNGVSSVTCGSNKHYDHPPPSCNKITCRNETILYPHNGEHRCTEEFEYQSTCTTVCNKGFGIPNQAISLITCKNNKHWSGELANCVDTQPPEFVDCPGTIHLYTDRGKDTAIATWKIPTARDNDGNNVTVKQTRGNEIGSALQKGFDEVRYKATDTNGNESPDCIFFVVVEKLTCSSPWPIFNDPYLNINCPQGNGYGSVCHFSCRGSYPLVGNSSMTCEMNKTKSSVDGFWNWGVGDKPVCKQNRCPKLLPPQHGAISCDKWMFGTQCMLQCNDKYDLPLVGKHGLIGSFSGMFSCSTSSGKWSPTSDVPDCAAKRNPGHLKLPGELFYYSGTCNNSMTQKQIKQNFITKMNELQNTAGRQGICPDTQQCNVDNVEVTCGPRSRRRRRSFSKRDKRELKNEIRVSFYINAAWQSSDKSTAETYVAIDAMLKRFGSLVQNKTRQGIFDVPGVKIDRNSIVYGDSDIGCQDGRYPQYGTLTCGACPLGTFLNGSTKECIPCKKGTYRNNDDQVTCATCPPGRSTPSVGSKNASDCIAVCDVGQFSNNGLEPCTPCPVSQYQASTMSRNCNACPVKKTTRLTGSSSPANCTDFDVAIKQSIGEKQLTTLNMTLNDITFVAWIKIPKVNFTFAFKVSSNGPQFQVRIGKSLDLDLNGIKYQTGIVFASSIWQHIAVTIDKSKREIKVFKNGHLLHQGSFNSTSPLSEKSSNVNIQLTSAYNPVVQVSNLMLLPVALGDADIKMFSQSCSGDRLDAMVSMEHFKSVIEPGIDIVAPSMCDAVDGCHPNPCHGHKCFDTLNDYDCICSGGYSGKNCETPPDYCKHSNCRNGATCRNGHANYTCECAKGFKGYLCEIKIVNGQWSNWEKWSACSVSCGGGNKTRSRQCNNPPPDPDGQPCNGLAKEHQQCNNDVCPSCPHAPRAYGVITSCNSTGDSIACSVKCRDGMAFVPGFKPLDVYSCGPDTYFKWNGEPPSCSRVYSPSYLQGQTSVKYVDFPCGQSYEAKKQLLENSKSLQCVKNGTCKVFVRIPDCPSRNKRAVSHTTAVLSIKAPLQQGDNLDLSSYLKGKTVTSAMLQLLHAIMDIDTSLQQLNASSALLSLNFGKQLHPIWKNTNVDAGCAKGTVRREAFCVACPQGTMYVDSKQCSPCGIGTYQGEWGQDYCKTCPVGFSTPFTQASSKLQCTISVTYGDSDNEPNESGDGGKDVIQTGIIVGCVLGCVAIIGIVIVYVAKRYIRAKSRAKLHGSAISLNMVHPKTIEGRKPFYATQPDTPPPEYYK